MNEDRKIKELFGKNNHFEVPAGYFDNLTQQIMDRLPEKEARIVEMPEMATGQPLWLRSTFHKVAAVIVAVIVVSGGVLIGLRHDGNQSHVQVAQKANMQGGIHNVRISDEGSFDQMADYTMMDNQDIYASLIAEN